MSTPRVSVLRGDQADRLQSCLNTVQAATGHHMFESCIDALEQLRDFCEGSPNLLPVIGSRDYSTIPILVGVLRERDPTTSTMVFQLLEYLLYDIRKNQKVFLRIEDSVSLLVSFMRDVDCRSDCTERLMFVEKSCILLSCLMKDAKKQFADAHGLQAIHTVLKHIASVDSSRWNEDWDSVAESLCDLIVEVVEEDPRNQASFRKCGALKSMIEMLLVKENNGSIIWDRYAESFLLAINSAITCNSSNQDFFRSMGAMEPLIRLLVAPTENEDIYLSALLLCVSLQYENPSVQKAAADTVAGLCRGGLDNWDESRLLPLEKCLKSVYVFRDECDNMRANHFDSDVVAASLKTLTEAIRHFPEGQYVFMHQKGAIELVVQCCNNIDECIMEASLSFVYQLLLNNTRTQIAFLEKGGLSSMTDCLHDYNVRIKLLALQVLSIVAAEHPVCRDEIRDAGILTHILHMLRLFPAEDVDLGVADAALGVLGHAVTENSQNQEHTRNDGGLSCIVNILKYCTENDPEHTQIHTRNERLSNAKTAFAPTAFTTIRSTSVLDSQRSAAGVMETALVALSNLAFKNHGNQNGLRELGIVRLCLQFLNTSPPEDLEIATLNLLVNLVDTNKETQDQLNLPWTAQVVARLLTQQPRVATMGCLFLSHLVWNHPQNQDLLATPETIGQLLHMIDAPISEDMDVDIGKVSISGRSSPVSAHSAYSNEENRPLQGHIRTAPRQDVQKGGIDAIAAGNGLPGPPGVMAGRSRRRLVTREQELEELCFYSLMALINLSYQNSRVQDIVQQLDGVETILKHLSSPIYETRKTATFCLGNLVKSHDGNARKLVDAGGVERMIHLLNDEEEDELSNKAFLTLTNMGELCITRIVELVDKCLDALEDHQDGMPYLQNMDTCSGHHNTVAGRALSDLEKSLPVLNGLIYLHPENRDCMIKIEGISCILHVFTKEVPEELVIYAGFVLANLSFTRDRDLQAQARRLGAFNLIENFIDTAQEEGRVICYTVLNNLTLNNTTNYAEISKCGRVLRHMVEDSSNTQAADEELRVEAAELLLSLFEQESHHQQLVDMGGLSAVEGLVSAPSSVISAKATQALRDLGK